MKILFLDRDGTIIVNQNYLDTPDGIEFLPGAIEGLQEFTRKGYQLVLVTNQSGIARGYFTRETLDAIHQRLEELLAQHDVKLAAIYICPHGPDDHCNCRKPKTGMLEQAARDFDFSREEVAMIGDSKGDIQLANNFGITAIQVTNGVGNPIPGADYVCKTLLDAVKLPPFNH